MTSRRRRWLAVGAVVATVVIGSSVKAALSSSDSPDRAVPPQSPQPRAVKYTWRCRAARRQPASTGLLLPAYSPASPFNKPIPPTARVSPTSSQGIQGLIDAASNGGFVVALERWTVALYYATEHTPLQRVRLTAAWAPRRFTPPVPIPPDARPDPSADGHMTVIDLRAGCEYDFWETRYENGQLVAGWANSLPLTGTGVYAHGYSARGSGFGLLGGLIFPNELRVGQIRHALIFSSPYTKAGGPVAPATESDGQSTSPLALPEGTLVRLDPTLDLSTLNLTPYERTIARALQVYGMYLADHGGEYAVALYAVNPLSYPGGQPYNGLLPEDTYVSLADIPLDRLQVIEPARR
jgi:hypothetical protein